MSAAVTTTIKAKRLSDRAAKRAASAQRRKEAQLAAARLQEQKDEDLAPAVQRQAITRRVYDEETGRDVEQIIQAPRLERAGVGFIRSDPIKHLAARGEARTERGEVAIIDGRHVKAANRLRSLWDAVGEGIGVGASDWGRLPSMRGTVPTEQGGHTALLAQVKMQSELEACAAFLGGAWPCVRDIALRGVTVDSWSGRMGWDRSISTGYLRAGLDRLIEHFSEQEPERKSKIRSIEFGPR